MFVRAFTIIFSVVALAGFVTAAPPGVAIRQVSECNTGSIQCCDSTIASDSYLIDELFGYLGLPVPAGGTQVGFTCSPVTVGGTGSGSTCVQQPVCCNGNVFNGISTGCSPITING
ncbi:hydrophobin [Imleria badia]|nr:hydrophobin [Imleria badia]